MRAKLFRAFWSAFAIAAFAITAASFASAGSSAGKPHQLVIKGTLVQNHESKVTVELVDEKGQRVSRTMATSLSLTDFRGTRTFDVGLINGIGSVMVRIDSDRSQIAHAEEKTEAREKLSGDTILSVKADAEVKP